MSRVIFIALLIAAAGVEVAGGIWAAYPYLAYKLPAIQQNWTSTYYTQMLRKLYPDHLLDPSWFIYGIRWPLAETCARFSVVVIVLAIIFICARFIGHEKKPAA
jgi:hypothetical protein